MSWFFSQLLAIQTITIYELIFPSQLIYDANIKINLICILCMQEPIYRVFFPLRDLSIQSLYQHQEVLILIALCFGV